MVTLNEFLLQCEYASWQLTIGKGEDVITASASCAKPYCGKERITLLGITLPQGLVGEIVDTDRNAGKLVTGTLIEDCAIFKTGDATLTVWRTSKKEN